MPNAVFELPAISDDKTKAFVTLSHYKPLSLDEAVNVAKSLFSVSRDHPLKAAYDGISQRTGILYETLSSHLSKIENTENVCAAFGRLSEKRLERLAATSSTFEEFYFKLPEFGAYDFELSLSVIEGKLSCRGTVNTFIKGSVTLSKPMKVFPVSLSYDPDGEINHVADAVYAIIKTPDAANLLPNVTEYNLKHAIKNNHIIERTMHEAMQQAMILEPTRDSRIPNPKTKH